MFRNYLLTAFRNLNKTKLFSFINIFGLAIGMAACLLILHYVNFENSYDTFQKSGDRTYRIRYERYGEDGSAQKFASCAPPVGYLIRERHSEVEKLGRLLRYKAGVSHEDIKFMEERMYFAEPQFFEIFDFKFLSGNPVVELAEPNKTFISQSTANRYFGDKNPIGKIISVDKQYNYEVVGIFEDVPINSHIKFDIILPWKNMETQYGPDYTENWGHSGSFTYVLLNENVTVAEYGKILDAMIDKEIGEDLKQYKMVWKFPLQPLKDIHLTSHYAQEYEAGGDTNTVKYLFVIAFFIIIMAWVNYINLSTARSLTRAKEVGLRKVVGASRRQLIMQFFMETILVNMISIILSVIVVLLSMPYFNNLTGMTSEFSIWAQHSTWFIIAGMLFVGIVLSGLYPVLALSSFQPVAVLKGKLGSSAKGINLRKVLVVFQFVMAFFLITGTFVVFNQISFMKNQELGFSKEQTLVVKLPRVRDDAFQAKAKSFKDKIMSYSEITKMCAVTEVPGKQIYWDAGGIYKAGDDPSKSKNYQIVGMDYEFIDVFELELVLGRNFSKEFTNEEDNLIFNETATSWIGFESPEAALNQKVSYWGKIYTIVGVLKDYHQQSLKEAFEPHIFRYMPYGRGNRGNFAFKLNTANMQETVGLIKAQYDEFFPGNPFDYFFLDEYYDQQYKADELFGSVFGVFSFFAIFVTGLGILGLSSFMAVQRTKEIGIRKVLGANISKIIVMLSKDFMILILLSFVIALPLTIIGINNWLDSFANKMDIAVNIYIWPLVIVCLITMLTMGAHVLKAALSNPVESLRFE